MKQLQIACVPANWDKSTITATGLTRNGRAALPKTTAAADLPQPWFSVWRGIVAALESLDPNGWAATFILAEKHYAAQESQEEGEEPSEPTPYIHLTIHRRWDDNTTAEPLPLDIQEAAAVQLFDWLIADDAPASIG